jgi:hypothetical protein
MVDIGRCSATSRVNVLLPAWRAPLTSTTRVSASASSTRDSARVGSARVVRPPVDCASRTPQMVIWTSRGHVNGKYALIWSDTQPSSGLRGSRMKITSRFQGWCSDRG